jgi:hypothetical protein
MEKRVLKKQPDLAGSLLVAATGIVVFAVYIRRIRSSQKAASLFDAETEAKVDREELSEDDGLLLAIRHRGKLTARKALKSLLMFVVSVAVATPFMVPFPLNVYFRPWGELALTICLGTFFLLVLDSAEVATEWFARREFEKEIGGQSNSER